MIETEWHPTSEGFVAGGPLHPAEYLRRVSSRHFPVLVITATKPPESALAKVLEPFGPEVVDADAKWRWWALGGRFTGDLICLCCRSRHIGRRNGGAAGKSVH